MPDRKTDPAGYEEWVACIVKVKQCEQECYEYNEKTGCYKDDNPVQSASTTTTSNTGVLQSMSPTRDFGQVATDLSAYGGSGGSNVASSDEAFDMLQATQSKQNIISNSSNSVNYNSLQSSVDGSIDSGMSRAALSKISSSRRTALGASFRSSIDTSDGAIMGNSTGSNIIGSYNPTVQNSANASIISSVAGSLLDSVNSSILGGSGNTISACTNSTIIGGVGLTITDESNTVYMQDVKIEGNLTVNGTPITGGGGDVSIDPYNDLGTVGTSTQTWDVSGNSTNYEVTLSGDITLNLTNVRNGDYGTLIVNQDFVGGRNITFGTVNGAGATHKVSNGGSGSPSLTSSPNTTDIISFTYNGSIVFWNISNDLS
jgi:hypothetical protein